MTGIMAAAGLLLVIGMCFLIAAIPSERKPDLGTEEQESDDPLEWTDFKMVHKMRLIDASEARYGGYYFLAFQDSPSFCTLRITKDCQTKLNDCIAGRSIRQAKARAKEAIAAIEFTEGRKCHEK